MAAGKHSSTEWTFSIDGAQGGSPQTITSYVTSVSGIKLTAVMQLITAFGDTTEKNLPTGISKAGPVIIGGFFDDTAVSGPHTIFGATGPDTSLTAGSRTFVAVVGNSKTFTIELYAQDYEVLGKNGNLTEYQVTLVQAGAGVWS